MCILFIVAMVYWGFYFIVVVVVSTDCCFVMTVYTAFDVYFLNHLQQYLVDFCPGQHHRQHTGEVGCVVSALEAAEKRADDQFVYCGRAAPDWW